MECCPIKILNNVYLCSLHGFQSTLNESPCHMINLVVKQLRSIQPWSAIELQGNLYNI